MFIEYIHSSLEFVINKQTQIENAQKLKFLDIVEFFAILEEMKKSIVTNITNYVEFFEELKLNTIDLDRLVTLSGRMGSMLKTTLDNIDKLYNTNKQNSELRRIIELYDSLGILDDQAL